ncbi:hypothetical protein GIB67_018443, partial [Kingdonia uniflora]
MENNNNNEPSWDSLVFPPSDHEGLHIQQQQQRHIDDVVEDGKDDGPPISEPQLDQHGQSDLRIQLTRDSFVKKLKLGFEILRVKFTRIGRSYCCNLNTGGGGADSVAGCGVVAATLFVSLLWWRSSRRCRSERMNRLMVLLRDQNEKITQLLDQVRRLNEILSAHGRASNRDQIQCWGSLDKVLKWYQWIAKYPTLKRLVDDMGFEEFLPIKAETSDNCLIHVLVKWWWPFTHRFHFPCGELGFTPLDFVMLMGLFLGMGLELPYDDKYSRFDEAEKMFSGITTNDIRYGKITLAYLKTWKAALNPELNNYSQDMDIVYEGAFIVYMMGNIFFSNASTSLLAGYLEALTDHHIIGASKFDWGTPIIVDLYQGLDEVSVLKNGKRKTSVLEFWFFEYCRVGMYLVKVLNCNHVYPLM